MFKQVPLVALLFVLSIQTKIQAQDSQNLATLVPNLYGPNGLVVDSEATLPNGQTHSAHFNSSFQSDFSQFNIALATQLLALPLPSPASGFTYSFDPSLGVFTRSTQSFGPILAERADTIGKKKFSVGFSFQHFAFDSIEGIPLNNVPAVFTHDDAVKLQGREDLVTTNNRIDVKVNQFTFFSTVGLTDRIDFSVAIPVVKTELNLASDATIQRIGTTNPENCEPGAPNGCLDIHFFDTGRQGIERYGNEKLFSNSGSASGIGDIIFRLKATAARWEHSGLAVALDVRAPSGDEKNLLGSGAVGIKPFAAYSYAYKRFSPHFNVGYQWNGKSVLAGDILTGRKKRLPNQFLYVVGADVGLARWLSLAIDLLGQRVIDAPRLLPETFTALVGGGTWPNIRFEQASSFNVNNGAVGLKVNPGGNLLLNFNVLLKLDNGGLRDKVTPLVGIAYTF
jgi:Putative MetA-pathway of phenol degradation